MRAFALLLAALVVRATEAGEVSPVALKLLPYPQDVATRPGALALGPVRYAAHGTPSATTHLARESLNRYLPRTGPPISVRLGSVEEGYAAAWLTAEQRAWLSDKRTSGEACLLDLTPDGITVVGKSRWGMLYGVQTVNQLAIEAARAGRKTLPCLTIRDWPDLQWRCLSPTLTWYSGWNRLEGYDLCNWGLDEWKWLVDWSLLHKCNAWAVCMYGYWPFTLPGYEDTTLQVDSIFCDPATGQKTPWRFVHANIRREFYPEVIRYAAARGIKVYAYIGKNSFNGGYILHHPEANAGGAAEALPFAPGVSEYWDACLGRILELGFDGFVFEDPEAYHVPNQNDGCYRTFWEPWAQTYGFHSRQETDANKPPLGVHVEYYGWLFHEFDGMIQRHAARLGRSRPDIYLISHFLLSRILGESKSPEEARRWLDLLDQKHGRKVPYIISEAREAEYVGLLGGDRVASLGGRGGSCTCAMRRIASINNNWSPGPMGTGIDWERDCQRRIQRAGGYGAMGYIFEWRLSEVYGYLAAQYLWRSAGVPGIDNDDQTGFLDYACRVQYGDKVGAVVARALDGGSNVNEAMVLDGVYGSQYPETGKPLHRDYQLLAARAETAAGLAWAAYRQFTGREPSLEQALYRSEDFRWNGYDPDADHLFQAETLRRLCVSTQRSAKMCEAALAHRLAMRLVAEDAPSRAVVEQFDRAVDASAANQRLYQLNYDDDYDWTDGLCARLTDQMKATRDRLLIAGSGRTATVKAWLFGTPGGLRGWTGTYDMTAPVVAEGALQVAATGSDPQLVLAEPLAVPVDKQCFAEIELSADRPGRAELFWTDRREGDSEALDPHDFRQHPPCGFTASGGDRRATYTLTPDWAGALTGLRLDPPDGAKIRLHAIRVRRLPAGDPRVGLNLDRPLGAGAHAIAEPVLYIPWEKQTDRVPPRRKAAGPGRYLSLDLGLNTTRDVSCLGVVFTVQLREGLGDWTALFRRAVSGNSRAWEHWDVPVPPSARNLELRLLTDSYSRAQDRSWPSWQWALWGRPQLVEVDHAGQRRVLYDFAQNAGEARPFVRPDADGRDRPFDGSGEDKTGATFRRVEPSPVQTWLAGAGRGWQPVEGFVAALPGHATHEGGYRSYLGVAPSWWGYAYDNGEASWTTAPVPRRRETAVVFIGGTNYTPGTAELWCDGRRLLGFETGSRADAAWRENGVELRYYHGGDTRDERTPYGLSGVFLLRLPASQVQAGKPLALTVKMLSGNDAWFMLHGYARALQAAARVSPPEPAEPCIAAFTPHVGGAFGVTGADYRVDTSRRDE